MMTSRDIDRVAPARDHEALEQDYMPQAIGWGLLVRRFKARRGLTEYGHDRFLNLREGQKDHGWMLPIVLLCIVAFIAWAVLIATGAECVNCGGY